MYLLKQYMWCETWSVGQLFVALSLFGGSLRSFVGTFCIMYSSMHERFSDFSIPYIGQSLYLNTVLARGILRSYSMNKNGPIKIQKKQNVGVRC